MADNVELNTGSGGDTIATEDISGVEYQKVKLVDGTAASTTAIPLSGDLTNGLDVDVTRVGGTVTTDNAGTFVVQEDGVALTALQLIDDTVKTLGTDTYTEATTKGNLMGAVRNDGNTTLVDTDNEIAPLQVNADGALYAHSPNKISTDNSTTATLGIGATYTGTGEDISQYSAVSVQIDSSHDSATDGMTFQFSPDDTNWDVVHLHTYTAADGGRHFQFAAHAQFFRVVYTNGGTGQTTFRVQTILHDNNILTSIHRLVDNTDPDRSAALVKSAIIAQAAGSGDFVPVQTTAAGNLKIAVEQISDGLDIGAGNAGTETQRVSISTDDINLASINTDASTIAGAVAAGQMQVDVIAALPAGANLVGDVGMGVRTSGGTSIFRSIDLDEGALEVVKGSAGQVYWLHVMNLASATRFVKIYNATSGTIGTGTPVLTFPIATQGDTNGAGFTLSIPNGIAFATGISIGASTGIADNDTGAPGANEVVCNLGFA